MRRIIVIGAGASGMTAAISAARAGAKVILLEHTDRVGKKILVTGNGRCNFTNQQMSEKYFRGGSEKWVAQVLQNFGFEDSLRFFESLGILAMQKNGYCYPMSGQASAVLDGLRWELERLGVEIDTDTAVEQMKKERGHFVVKSKKETWSSDGLILACGSQAASKTGSDGSGYALARQWGHSIMPVLPALTAIKTAGSFLKQWAGVRVEGEIAVKVDGKIWNKNRGELQLTDYGVSGIPAFQISRYVSMALYQKKKVSVVCDFWPGQSEEEVQIFLDRRRQQLAHLSLEDGLTGLFPKKLAAVLIRQAKLDGKTKWGEVNREEEVGLAHVIKQMELSVLGTGDFEQAQVCAGGVSLKEVNPATMESRLVSELYFAGEILDVDGMCGGYNLQFAWSSGFLAGKSAAKMKK
ncbi:MAG: NAD(P)/FAD-dependent oxidoreductase [Lachnospiraceae bacterium]